MSLVIEDGSIVAGADTYASVAEARAYATKRGLIISATDSVVEQLLVKACDFLQSLEDRYKGARVDDTQALAWPRQEVYVYNGTVLLDKDSIPQVLKDAQCQLAYDASKTDLQPTGEGRQVIMKQVDVIVTQWSDTKSSTVQPVFNKAMAILAPLLRTTSSISVTRV